MGCADALVGEHLRHCVDVRTQRDLERGKGVTEAVEGQSFLDSAYRCYLFEVVVTLLVGWYW